MRRPPGVLAVRRYAARAALVAALAGAGAAQAWQVVPLPGPDGLSDAAGAAEALEDPSGALTFAEIDGAAAGRFSAEAPKNLGFSRSALWVRFALENPSDAPRALVLTSDTAAVEHLDVWLRSGDGPARRLRGGLAVPPAERGLHFTSLGHEARLQLAPGERLRVWVRHQTRATLHASLTLWTPERHAAWTRVLFTVAGANFAVLILLALLGLQTWMLLREAQLLTLVGLNLSLTGYQVSKSGFADAFLWTGARSWTMVAMPLFAGLTVAVGLLFTRYFLREVQRPRLELAARALGWTALLSGLLAFADPWVASQAVTACAGLAGLVGALYGAAALWGGYRAARIFLVAMLGFVVLSLPNMLGEAGLIAASPLTQASIFLASTFTIVTFSFAAADRIEIASRRTRGELQAAVEQRTAELAALVGQLRGEVEERRRAEQHRAASEEQLRKAQKMEAIGQLAGGVAHDFNNVLTVINTSVDLLKDDTPEDDQRRALLDEIAEAVQRAAGLTRQLLAFGKRQLLEPRPVDVNALVENLRKMLARVIGEDVALHLALQPDLGRVVADAGQLEQVLLNLVVNARDAMEQGGRITIETRQVEVPPASPAGRAPGRYVQIAVRDTGHGMAPEVLQRIFEPFFSTKSEGRGTGLGLATTYGIVQQHRGWVEAESEPGKGSTFWVNLPLDPAPAGEEPSLPPALVAQARPGGSETVLLVEDERPVRDLACRMLRKLGYRVLSAGTPGEAMIACQQDPGRIDLLLSDVVLPGQNGRELAAELAGQRPGLKVLFMSGYARGHLDTDDLVGAGLQFMGKPFTTEELAQRVRAAIAAPPPAVATLRRAGKG